METKKYWTSPEQLKQQNKAEEASTQITPTSPEAANEFSEDLPVIDMFNESNGQTSSNRRDFLKMLGFSVTAATVISGCETHVRKAIPYVIKPEEVTPGRATWYASSFINGSDYCPILVKTREGRPIKIEGNPHSSVTEGGVGTLALASVLSLYNTNRLKQPAVKTEKGWSDVSWAEMDKAIKGKLSANPEASIAILSNTVISPSTRRAIDRFKASYPNARLVEYDNMPMDGLLSANAKTFGRRAMPDYRFDKAAMIASFDADFLGGWGNSTANTNGYGKMRRISEDNPAMSQHWQFESRMSMTGSNADYRVPMAQSQLGAAMVYIYNRLANRANAGSAASVSLGEAETAKLKVVADGLWKNRGRSLVICGMDDEDAQLMANRINQLLGNYGSTIDWDHPTYLRRGSNNAVEALANDMRNGRINTLIVYGANPVYNVPGFAEAIGKVGTTISFSTSRDETAELCKYNCPDNHNLESWSDVEAKAGYYSICQPVIRPLFNTRQGQQTLLTWAGEETDWFGFMTANWRNNILTGSSNPGAAWNRALQVGVYESGNGSNLAGEDQNLNAGTADISGAASRLARNASSTDLEVVLYESTIIGDGSYTDNPWLQETPDPVSKSVWGNFISVNPDWAIENGIEDGQIISISTAGGSIELPAAHQPGQHRGAVSVAVGYGRTATGRAVLNNGANAYSLMNGKRATSVKLTGAPAASGTAITIDNKLVRMQDFHTLHDDVTKRPIVKETTLAQYKENRFAGNEDRAKILHHLKSFYPDRFANKNGMHWGMAIDLSACTGCSACHVACVSENNIPVVGKNEMDRKHEMHWIRIDRYYAGDINNPEVVYQPMLCQHCDNAPCENVCPVAATNHSSEGINQMAYNRCIGTRYCANNCPYKVRRFNWFDYMGADSFGKFNDKDPLVAKGEPKDSAQLSELTRMVLNPDVTVRSRGVMEKCSFCVQRIQESKLEAKKEGRQLRDGDVKTACQAACTTGAITFGNLFDEDSKVHELTEKNARAFRVLEDIHTLPSISYLTKVRNKDAKDHQHKDQLDNVELRKIFKNF